MNDVESVARAIATLVIMPMTLSVVPPMGFAELQAEGAVQDTAAAMGPDRPGDLSHNTLPRRPMLGALVGDAEPGPGVAVRQVIEGSPAHGAGLMPGDVLLETSGTAFESTTHFLALLREHPRDVPFPLRIARQGRASDLTMMLAPADPEAHPGFRTSYASVRTDAGNLLRLMVTWPDRNGPHPVVVLVSGTGCISLDNLERREDDPIAVLIESLHERGYATVRVEKSGMGDSRGVPCGETDFVMEVDGYRKALAAAMNDGRVARDRVYVLGLSLGGVMAPMLARERPVAGIVVFGTVGRTWLEYEIENTRRQRVLRGLHGAELDAWMRADVERLTRLFVFGERPDQIRQARPEIAHVVFDYPQSHEYFRQVAEIPVRSLWDGLDVPVLAIHGTSDYVSSELEHREVVQIVERGAPGRARFHSAANADHWGLHAESPEASLRRDTDGVHRGWIAEIIAWLDATAA